MRKVFKRTTRSGSRILNIKNSITEHMNININRHSLNFYSDCLKSNIVKKCLNTYEDRCSFRSTMGR